MRSRGPHVPQQPAGARRPAKQASTPQAAPCLPCSAKTHTLTVMNCSPDPSSPDSSSHQTLGGRHTIYCCCIHPQDAQLSGKAKGSMSPRAQLASPPPAQRPVRPVAQLLPAEPPPCPQHTGPNPDAPEQASADCCADTSILKNAHGDGQQCYRLDCLLGKADLLIHVHKKLCYTAMHAGRSGVEEVYWPSWEVE
jgi:hypothetical protein